MNYNNILNHKDIYEIKELIKRIKGNYKGDIKKFARDENIVLMYLPIENNKNTYFSSVYLSLKNDNINFIGVNSSDYYDNQLFAIAHELYHHYEKDEVMNFSRISLDEKECDKREAKANRFAAEILLPEEDLKIEIEKINNYNIDINDCTHEKVLRLIAKLQCEFKLPYKAIVRRLKEVNAINEHNYEYFYNLNPREKDSKYYKIGINMDKDTFEKLNEITCEYGVEGNDLEDIILNYEDGIIDMEEFIEDLSKFNKSVEDFGYEEDLYIDEQDLDEISSLFEDEDE